MIFHRASTVVHLLLFKLSMPTYDTSEFFCHLAATSGGQPISMHFLAKSVERKTFI